MQMMGRNETMKITDYQTREEAFEAVLKALEEVLQRDLGMVQFDWSRTEGLQEAELLFVDGAMECLVYALVDDDDSLRVSASFEPVGHEGQGDQDSLRVAPGQDVMPGIEWVVKQTSEYLGLTICQGCGRTTGGEDHCASCENALCEDAWEREMDRRREEGS